MRMKTNWRRARVKRNMRPFAHCCTFMAGSAGAAGSKLACNLEDEISYLLNMKLSTFDGFFAAKCHKMS